MTMEHETAELGKPQRPTRAPASIPGRMVRWFGRSASRRAAERPIEEAKSHPEVARRDAIFRRCLAAADVVAAAFALTLCISVLGDDSLRSLTILALPLVVVAGKLKGLYDRDELLINKTTIDQAPQLFQLATLYALLIWIMDDALVAGDLGSLQVLVLWASLFFSVIVARHIARQVARRLAPVERCMFVGSVASHARLRDKLNAHQDRAILVGRMSLASGGEASVDDATASLREIVVDLNVHRVIVEPSEEMPQLTLDFVREAKATGLRVSLLPRILEVVGSSIEVDDLDGLTLLAVRRFGLSRSSQATKRVFDICGAVPGLLVLSPLIALIAALIKLDSPGPVFFRQTRVGREGKQFRIWKFRTMIVDADERKTEFALLNEADGLFKIAEDPRITRVGGVLRRYSLDELPQLFNVLCGEMSLVGPRPLICDEDARITGLDRRRLHLLPGMTGHWQILGSARVPLAEMVKLDYRYVAGWSLWSDIKILARTLPYMVARRGM
ncbi:MAG: exopolysaccharide biosynthesis polyprenyl glycosylphosphotransferase [Acidimicrobiales bacterium]